MGRFLFAGDTYLMQGTKGQTVTSDIFDIIGKVDYFCANIEAPAGDRTFENGLGFKFNNNQIEEIANAGINVAILGNNHMYDCGIEGIELTEYQCNKNNIKIVGASSNARNVYLPLIVTDKDGNRVAIFSAQHRYYGSAIYDNEAGVADIWNHVLFSKIKEIKNEVDYIVLNAHCGLENKRIPLNTWRNIYKLYIDAGVDVIIGHHPHITQCEEIYTGKHIIYSIGNFAFDLEEKYKNIVSSEWNKGTLVAVDFDRTGIKIKFIKGEYVNKVFKIREIIDNLDKIEDVYDELMYKKQLEEEFQEYITIVKNALMQVDIDYKTLHHFLALDEQRIVIQEYLELKQREGVLKKNEIKFDLSIYPLIIWGTGKTGLRFYRYAREKAYKIVGFTESNKSEDSIEVDGKQFKIYSIEDIKHLKQKINIVIASIYEKEIQNTIKSSNILCNVVNANDIYIQNSYKEASVWKTMNWEFSKTINRNGINYRIMEKGWPVILYFHGAGSCGKDNMQQVSSMGSLGKALIDYGIENGISIYAPQCPLSNMWFDVDYKSGKFDIQEALKGRNVLDNVWEYIKSLQRDIYVVGFSIGGYAGWLSLIQHYDDIKAALLISCGGDVKLDNPIEIGRKVTLVHGDKDDVVDVTSSVEMAKVTNCKFIKCVGYDHDIVYTLNSNEWHRIIGEAFNL